MALPDTILTSVMVHGRSPPFKSSGGAFYVIVPSGLTQLHAYKSTDPGVTAWVQQDSAGQPTGSPGFDKISVVQDGDILHIATLINDGGIEYQYNTFNMATDAWVIANELIDVSDAGGNFYWISIAVRSDGDVVVVYAGELDRVMGGDKIRVDFNIRTTGTWGGPQALDAGGDVHYGAPNCVKAETTDHVHVM